jgi:hypothetical protein
VRHQKIKGKIKGVCKTRPSDKKSFEVSMSQAVLEMKRGQANFTKKISIKGPLLCTKKSSAKSREYAQLGMVSNNLVKFQ